MNPVHATNGNHHDSGTNGTTVKSPKRRESPINVLILEDQPLIRKALRSLIDSNSRFRVCGEAWERGEARKAVTQTRADVVVMELSLGSEETISLIRQIRDLNDRVQVVVLSRFDEATYALPAFKAGAKAFVMKHEPPEAVLDAIRSVARGNMRFSWEIRAQMLDRITSRKSSNRDNWMVSLSPRELEVVSMIATGMTSREIADRMQVSIKTVEAHRAHIKQKANLDNGTALVRYSMAVTNEIPSIPI